MQIGDTMAKRYELREALGAGGLGRVFRAFDERELREVAVKVLDPARCPEDAMRRYGALVTSAAKAKHPAIVLPRVQAAADGEPPIVVSELQAGEDLDGLRARVGALPWRRAAELVGTCAEALAALATATGAAHRALKPGNVRVSESGELRLLDFGVAELGVQPVPKRGDVCVEYRAPEQLEGGPGDARSDVFTLGVLLFEMATAVHPFSGPSTFKVMHKVLLQAAPRPSEVAPEQPVPATIEALLARALARRPSDRFADAAELGKMLALVRRAGDAELAPAPARRPIVNAPDDGTSLIPGAEAEEDPLTVLRLMGPAPEVKVAAPAVLSTPVIKPVIKPVITPVPTLAVAAVTPKVPLRAGPGVGPIKVAATSEGPPLLSTGDSAVAPVPRPLRPAARPPAMPPATGYIADPSTLMVRPGTSPAATPATPPAAGYVGDPSTLMLPPTGTPAAGYVGDPSTLMLPPAATPATGYVVDPSTLMLVDRALQMDAPPPDRDGSTVPGPPRGGQQIDPTLVLKGMDGPADVPVPVPARRSVATAGSSAAPSTMPAPVRATEQPSPLKHLVMLNIVLILLAAAGLAWVMLG